MAFLLPSRARGEVSAARPCEPIRVRRHADDDTTERAVAAGPDRAVSQVVLAGQLLGDRRIDCGEARTSRGKYVRPPDSRATAPIVKSASITELSIMARGRDASSPVRSAMT